jgi:hypothetical protein
LPYCLKNVQLGPNYGRNAQLEPPVCCNSQHLIKSNFGEESTYLGNIPCKEKRTCSIYSKEGQRAKHGEKTQLTSSSRTRSHEHLQLVLVSNARLSTFLNYTRARCQAVEHRVTFNLDWECVLRIIQFLAPIDSSHLNYACDTLMTYPYDQSDDYICYSNS